MAEPQGDKAMPVTMPTMTGEEMHLHEAVQFWENVQAALAHAMLLKAAMGMEPDEAKQIVDVDLNLLPVLPQDHPQYYRQLETKLCIRKLRTKAIAFKGMPSS